MSFNLIAFMIGDTCERRDGALTHYMGNNDDPLDPSFYFTDGLIRDVFGRSYASSNFYDIVRNHDKEIRDGNPISEAPSSPDPLIFGKSIVGKKRRPRRCPGCDQVVP